MRRLRDAGDRRPQPSQGKHLASAVLAAMRARNWVTGLAVPIVAAIAVGIAVVVVAGANNGAGGPAPSSLSAGFPPARPTADFADTAALAGRGISEPLGQVASFGTDLVAVGGQSGGPIAHARFFFSPDSGRTWQLGSVKTTTSAQPPPGHAAALVAGGPRGWIAVGPTAVWTSQNGQSWLFGDHPLPQLAGDKISTLVATSSGFLAAGQNVPGGDAAKASPVVWLSTNGTSWRRLGVTQLGLAAGTGRVLGITAAAANNGVIVLTGTVAGATTSSQAWRSANGGASWTPVTIPATGAAATISGIAPLKTGFIAVRPAIVAGFARAAVYTSADGAAWQQSSTLATTDNAPLTIGLVSGGPNGAVVSGQAHGLQFAFLSPDGVNWTGTDPVSTTAAEQISGVALTSTGQAVMSGTSAGDPARQQPLLTLIGPHGAPTEVKLALIPGALGTEVAVNAIAASRSTAVAAGSADGLPALWLSSDSGSTWQRATGSTPAVLTRPGMEQLTGVAHGSAGWLAVGGAAAGAAEPPVVVGSADGRTWSAADGAAAFTGPGQVVTAAVAAGPGGYVIVGHQTSGGRTVAAAWYAPGLTGWARAAGALTGPGNPQMNAVTATAKGFAAVGAIGTRPAVWLSATGRSWSLVALPLPASAVRAELQYVVANGNTVAAVGTGLTAAGQQPFAAVSADGGATWTETALPAPRTSAVQAGTVAVTALAAAGDGFTATGTYGAPGNEDVVVWSLPRGSAPGTTWTAVAPAGTGMAGPGTQAITALTGGGAALTGVGFTTTATPAAGEMTLWQPPVRG